MSTGPQETMSDDSAGALRAGSHIVSDRDADLVADEVNLAVVDLEPQIDRGVVAPEAAEARQLPVHHDRRRTGQGQWRRLDARQGQDHAV